MKIYPKKERFVKRYKNKLNLIEQIRAYGLKLSSREKLSNPPEKTIELFNKLLSSKVIPEIENAHEFKSANDRKYYSGGWFEEYIYLLIKKPNKKLKKTFIK